MLQNVHRILDNPKVSEHNKIRVVLLYSLRYTFVCHAHGGSNDRWARADRWGGDRLATVASYERNANYDIASVIDKLTATGVRTDLVAVRRWGFGGSAGCF